MPHIPAFPPVARDWLPGKPFVQPPLPRFMWNPAWLPAGERQALEAETGMWATSRAEAMIPQSAGPEAVRRAALSMWQGLQRRYGIEAPAPTPMPVPARARRPRRAPAATPVTPTVALTSEQRQKLTSDVEEYTREFVGTARARHGPVLPSTLDVQEWARMQFRDLEISEAEAANIIAMAPRIIT